MQTSTTSLPSDAPEVRLCHLTKWPDFDGFGFNLQVGQYIGKVDEDSPAEHAELREGDRIIEVNGVNISSENHKQVVERIKAQPNETRLLVVDKQADNYYKSINWTVSGDQSNVRYCRTPNPRPAPPHKAAAAAVPDQNEQPAIERQAAPESNNKSDDANSFKQPEQAGMSNSNGNTHHPQQSNGQANVTSSTAVIKSMAEQQVQTVLEQASRKIQHLAEVSLHQQDDDEKSAETNQPKTSTAATTTTTLDNNGTAAHQQASNVSSVDSLAPPIDNQQTIQAIKQEAAIAEQTHSIRLSVTNDYSNSEPEKENNNSSSSSNQLSPSSNHHHQQQPQQSAVKHHHNFIVINSEEQFAKERQQLEQQQNLLNTKYNRTNGQLAGSSELSASNNNASSLSRHSSASQHSDAGGSLGNRNSSNNNNDSLTMDLNLNMTASELRQMLSKRKNLKAEAKKAQLDLRQKYEIIQQM